MVPPKREEISNAINTANSLGELDFMEIYFGHKCSIFLWYAIRCEPSFRHGFGFSKGPFRIFSLIFFF